MSAAALLSAGRAAVRLGPPWRTDLLAAILFLALGIGLVLHPYASGREMPGDLQDARFILSLLEFFYRTLIAALHGQPANFLDAPFFYPWPRVTNFSETFWGDAEVYALARALGLGSLASFQAWFVAGFALTYVAAFVSFRGLGLRTWGAAAGGFLFTFSLPMTAQFAHAQLVYRLWVPPAVLAFDRFLTRRSLRAGAACVLFLALQLAASIYLGLFLCLLLASYVVALCLIARNRLAPPRWAAFRSAGAAELVTTGILLAAGLVLLAIVEIPYFDVQSMYGFTRSWDDVVGMLPRPGSYLLSGSSELWPNLSARFPYPLVWEHQLFPGLSAIIPLAWFLLSKRARTRQRLAAPMIAAVGILFAITIDLSGYTLYRLLIYPIRGFSSIRAVSRIILVMMLPLAALIGMLIDDLAATRTHILPRRLLAVALFVFLVAECSFISSQGAPTPDAWRERLEALEARLPKKLPPHAALAIAEIETPGVNPWLTAIDASVAAATLGIHTLNGYSGNYPPTWRTMRTCRDVGDNIKAGRHFLAEYGLPVPDIAPFQIVLVGFAACQVTGLGGDPRLRVDRTYRFANGGDGNVLTGEGFSDPENWGRWTDANNAFLFFSLASPPPGPVSVAVEADSFSPTPDRRQSVTVVANGHVCGRLTLAAGKPHAEVICPTGAFHINDNVLNFRIAHPARPIDLGVNDDERLLGLGLRTVTLEEVQR
jgi:hypothetical protein